MPANRIETNGISLNHDAREVLAHGPRVELTAFEFDILEMLMRSAGRVLSRDASWRISITAMPPPSIAEFVSTSARTFRRPPDTWAPSVNWADKSRYFAGSPQGLVADLIHEGATGASGNAYEPFLNACVRPDYLLPAYQQGRNLAESYYLSLVYLSWQSVILGDPLCVLKP